VLVATPAGAQASGQNQTAAQALYDEARRLMEAKDYASACPKFKESYALDPGGGTLLNLADCHEKEGKSALAWTTFKEALVVAQRDANQARVEFAKTHLSALELTLSYVTVNVASPVDGLTVTVDGTPLGSAAWGVAVPVDPGPHAVRAEAPSRKPFEQTLEIAKDGGHREVVDVPALELAEDASGAAVGSATDDKHAGGFLSGRNVGWIAAGVGVVGIGVGGYFGLKAFSDWDDRNQACKSGCTAGAKASGESASDAATRSTVGFAVGAGALAVGAVLIFTSGGSDKRAARAPTLEASVLPSRGGAVISMRHPW